MVYRVSSTSARVTQCHPIFKEKEVDRDDPNLIRTETNKQKKPETGCEESGTIVLKAYSKVLPFREPEEKKTACFPLHPLLSKTPTAAWRVSKGLAKLAHIPTQLFKIC